ASAVMGVLVPTAEDASQAAVSGPGMAGQVVPDRFPSGAGIDTPVARGAIHAEVPEMPGATKVAPVRSEVAGPWPALVDPQIEPMAAVTETSVGSNTDAVTMAEPIEPPQIPAKQVIQSAATQPAAVPLHPSGPKAAASMVVSEPDRAEAVAATTESVALEDAAALPLPASDGSGDKRLVLPVVIGFWERVFSALAIPATSLPELEVRKSLPLVSTGPAELPAGTSQLAKDGGITLTTTPAVPLVPIAPQDDWVTIQPDEAVIVPAPGEAEPTSRKTTLVVPLQMPAPPSLLAGPTVVAVTDTDPEGQLDEGFSMVGAPATGPGPAPVVYGSPAAHQSSPQLPVPQVATQIVTALSHADGATELALSPEELGHVRLRLEPDAANPDRMVVMITFERPETLDLFRRHAGDLAEALRSAGYAGADIGFGQGGTGSNGFDKAPGRGSADDRSDVGPPVSPPPRHTVGASLDLRL
ncbi:MAG TPA: flagellar hook-length control protein FliK, partial [Tabrizicola sp.]|nr:flagellar hook-length control protein FliK [Tabrizicola sp.]